MCYICVHMHQVSNELWFDPPLLTMCPSQSWVSTPLKLAAMAPMNVLDVPFDGLPLFYYLLTIPWCSWYHCPVKMVNDTLLLLHQVLTFLQFLPGLDIPSVGKLSSVSLQQLYPYSLWKNALTTLPLQQYCCMPNQCIASLTFSRFRCFHGHG